MNIFKQKKEQKRFGILHKIVPDVARFGAIVNPNYPYSAIQMRDLESAATDLRRQLFIEKDRKHTDLILPAPRVANFFRGKKTLARHLSFPRIRPRRWPD